MFVGVKIEPKSNPYLIGAQPGKPNEVLKQSVIR